jgi:large subunit ribosomal protein L22
VKNEGEDVAAADLIVKTIFVDGGRTLKRMNPAPQGRAYRLRKRSNHVTIIVDSKAAVIAAKKGEDVTPKLVDSADSDGQRANA